MIKKNNIKLGIIGGAGPLASSTLYQMLIEGAQKKYKACEDWDFPEIIIINFPFSPMLSKKESLQNNKALIIELQNCFSRLENIGVTHVVVACNTLHTLIDQIDMGKLQFISLVGETIKESLLCARVLVLGTETTVQSNIYTTLNNNSWYDNQQQERISEIIDMVLQGNVTEELAQELAYCIEHSAKVRSCDAVILACTELSMINKNFPLFKYVLSTITIIDPFEVVVNIILRAVYAK